MTRKFETQIECPNCRHVFPAQDSCKAWIRDHPRLRSREDGIVFCDMDLVALRYKPVHDKFGDRTIQLIMVVELKTRDSRLQDNPAQVEIFGYLKRFFYNGRGTPTKPAEYDCGIFRSRKIRSELRGTDKILWAMGAHLLEMDGPDPERSVCRSWDGIHVTVEQVASLLRFDLNPFDPGQDLGNEYFRRRHKPHQESLPLTNSA